MNSRYHFLGSCMLRHAHYHRLSFVVSERPELKMLAYRQYKRYDPHTCPIPYKFVATRAIFAACFRGGYDSYEG